MEKPQTTLAIYMGKSACSAAARKLIAAGLAPSIPVVTVENASLPTERVLATTLGLLPLIGPSMFEGGPAMILVGRAVAGALAKGAGEIAGTAAISR